MGMRRNALTLKGRTWIESVWEHGTEENNSMYDRGGNGDMKKVA
jgi:hypothetical protein